MFRNRLFALGIGALGLLFVGCSRTPQAKPTTPVTKAPAPAPATVVAETPSPVPGPEAEAKAPLDPIYFDFDRYDIQKDDAQLLQLLGDYLATNADRFLTIAGHCDERGTVEYNIALGDRRANAARDFLVRLGIDTGRIKTISYGEERPADLGHGEDAWAKNRRDEFRVEQKQRAQK